MKRQEAFFKSQLELNDKLLLSIQSAESTLLNVLVAIRQNEYLQAWYPAQKGYPEMKVVGDHPCSDVAIRKEQLTQSEKKEEEHVN